MDNLMDVYQVGMMVNHRSRHDWGPGKVLAVEGQKLKIYFRDCPGEDAIKTLVPTADMLELAASQIDPQLDNLPPYRAGKLQTTKKRLTIDEGLVAFHRLFPLYFEDPKYFNDPQLGERAYKLAAHQLFVNTLGDGKGRQLLQAGHLDEVRKHALAVEAKVNLLSSFERMALRDGLKDDAAAHRFFQALFNLIEAPRLDQTTFEGWITAVELLPVQPGKSRAHTWPILTLLPYLACPDRQMFLKPDKTKACADCLRFELQYRTELNWLTYQKLLEMAELLLRRLQPFGARDMIDVQSFIWVIGEV
jgi:hypothetical protein